MFEKLQEWDETRLNHLRDILTQFETFESDRYEREQPLAEPILRMLLDIDTSQEIQLWSRMMMAGRPITERHARQLSNSGSTATNPPRTSAASPLPPTPRSGRTAQTDISNERNSEISNRPETSGGKTPSKHSPYKLLGSAQCLMPKL
jgi:hypothetical protein